jgi:hypothetical protein
MVSRVAEALLLRGDICLGEVQGRAPPEFNFGNSPFERRHSAIGELQGWHKSGRDHDRAIRSLLGKAGPPVKIH